VLIKMLWKHTAVLGYNVRPFWGRDAKKEHMKLNTLSVQGKVCTFKPLAFPFLSIIVTL
jgi:hypothetical protein